MIKPPRDDSDDLPRLKTGCKNFDFSEQRRSHTKSDRLLQFHKTAQKARQMPNALSTVFVL
ncbi:hypothetical protein [Nostoc sp. MG11]|uniref:hypothetical protein n=1 Tax=Nostoc sp. MG11 TaxID=2721166 RepID=UPI00186847B7|nr:hypothetical protein [Nostoc sp. MG11]